jgi:hypothetical protein
MVACSPLKKIRSGIVVVAVIPHLKASEKPKYKIKIELQIQINK